jgi:copper chaperone CopZ
MGVKVGYYIHYVPGRIRIQTPFLHNNPRNAEEFEAYIKGIKGIISVKSSLVAGSAIMLFDEKIINCEQLIGILERHGYFLLSKAETSDQVIKRATEKFLEKL